MAIAAEVPHFPDRIGRFDLVLPIGTGGMGSVYLGRVEVTPGLYRDIAVKLMHPQFRAEAEVRDELLHEARVAARIIHPNVVRVHEAGDSPHGVFMAMDYVEGATLASVLRGVLKQEELVPLPIAGRILCDALTGLHAAHEQRDENGKPTEIIHRDFSPQNILVGIDGISRLADFGIAKAVGELGGTATGVVKGKVGYMAPEQARGERIDRRCDVWAAGVVAWETIAGQRLFRGANDAATLLMIISGEPPPGLRARRSDVSHALDAAIMNALQRRLDQRVATAAALRVLLEGAFAESGGLAAPEEVGEFVRDLVGPDLEKRRKRAASVVELRGQIASVSASAERRARLESSTSLDPIPTSAETTTPDVPAPSPARRSPPDGSPAPSRRLLPYAIGAALAGGVAALAIFGGGSPVPAQEPVARDESAPAPRESGGAVQATTPPPVAAETAGGVLVLRADDPIAQVRIGTRNIALPEPVESVEVPLTAEERGAALLVVATSADGRKREIDLAPGVHEAEVAFPALAGQLPPAPKKPAPAAPAAKTSPSLLEKGPGLAESPYGKTP
jgi:eukaryotic-like serine/threonine-protein kinase